MLWSDLIEKNQNLLKLIGLRAGADEENNQCFSRADEEDTLSALTNISQCINLTHHVWHEKKLSPILKKLQNLARKSSRVFKLFCDRKIAGCCF